MDADDQTDSQQSVASSDIFTTIGAAAIPDEEKGALLAKMMETIQYRTLNRIIDALDESDNEAMEKIVDQDDPEELEKFLEAKVPNYPNIFEEEAKRLRKELEIEYSRK